MILTVACPCGNQFPCNVTTPTAFVACPRCGQTLTVHLPGVAPQGLAPSGAPHASMPGPMGGMPQAISHAAPLGTHPQALPQAILLPAKPRSKKKFWIITGSTAAVVLIGVFVTLYFAGVFVSSALKSFTAKSGAASIDAPARWQGEISVNPAAEIAVGDEAEDTYLIVVSTAKDEVEAKTHTDFAQTIISSMSLGLVNGRMTQGARPLSIHGRSAVQYLVQGVIDGVECTYVHAFIDGTTSYHEVIAWTPTAHFEKREPELMRIVESFRELPK